MSIAFNDRAGRGSADRRGETAPIGHLVEKLRAELEEPTRAWPSYENPREIKDRLVKALKTIKLIDPRRIKLTRTRTGQLIDLACGIAVGDLAKNGGILAASNSHYGDKLGVKAETMTTIFRDLRKAGMIEERNPTINHRRWCRTTHDGHLDGRGYSLEPAIAKLDELERTAQTLEREQLTLTATQFEARQILAECSAIASELCDEHSIEQIVGMRRALKAARAEKSIGRTSAVLHSAAALKASLLTTMKSKLERTVEADKISDQTGEDSRQHHTDRNSSSVKVSALRGGSSGDVPPLPCDQAPRSATKSRASGNDRMTCGLTTREAHLLFASGRKYIPATDDHQDWIIAACDIGRELNINPRLMAKGFETLGIEQMLWGLHIVHRRLTKGHIDTNPGAYFNGMLRKAEANELNIDRSIWGIRTELGLAN